tara:strand:+ start:6303 stop:6461 length:159 start_codon:yes stop_codon:yes gene_type:complete
MKYYLMGSLSVLVGVLGVSISRCFAVVRHHGVVFDNRFYLSKNYLQVIKNLQ